MIKLFKLFIDFLKRKLGVRSPSLHLMGYYDKENKGRLKND